MALVTYNCFKCAELLPPKHFMTCAACKIKLHIDTCSTVSESHYNYLSTESRARWKCGTCIWKNGNAANITTPGQAVPQRTSTSTHSNSKIPQRSLNVTFTSANTKKAMMPISQSSPTVTKDTPIVDSLDLEKPIKKKTVTNVTILTELVNFREQVTKQLLSQDEKINTLSDKLVDFKSCFTELNAKYSTLRADVDRLCESFDGAKDTHELLTNTLESTCLKLQELQTEKCLMENNLDKASTELTSIKQDVSKEKNQDEQDVNIDNGRELNCPSTTVKTTPPPVVTTTAGAKSKAKPQRQQPSVLKIQKKVQQPSLPTTDVTAAIDSISDEHLDVDGAWQIVSHRRKAKRQGVVIGKAQQHQLQAVERTKRIHACFLRPDTTQESMIAHMEGICKMKGFAANKLTLKHEHYASFVLTVPECAFHILLTPESWPAGTEVCEWFPRGVRREYYSRPRTPGQNQISKVDTNISAFRK